MDAIANPKALRMIWNVNAPWTQSGYANQMLELMPMLVKEHQLAMSCFYGLEGGVVDINGVRMYPKMGSIWGEDALLNHGRVWGADVHFTLQDIWVLNMQVMNQIKNWIPVVPIDHDPVPQAVLDRLKSAYRVITYSQFGHQQLTNHGIHSTYIPHTVNTDIFKVPSDKKANKKRLNLNPDVFLFGMVADNKDNPSRKSFQEVMDAFALFHKKHPKSALYFHTVVNKQGGFHIPNYAKHLGIEEAIFHLDVYDYLFQTDKARVADIMGAFDVLLAPSTNEGFGVPIIEAQACGVPVISNDFTSMSELVEDMETGWLTEIAHKRYTQIGGYVAVPSVKSIREKMELAYRSDLTKMGKKARKSVYGKYRTDMVYTNYWKPFFEKLFDELVAPLRELEEKRKAEMQALAEAGQS